jgi:hypothetical protein
MLTASEIIAIETAITSAVNFHRHNPFLILRERGAVADLRQRLMGASALGTHVLASPTIIHVHGKPRYKYHSTPLKVLRTQLEISVGCRAPDFKKAVDVAILSSSPTLRFRGNGPGDVVQQFDVKDIDAAIEVKTSQSSDPVSRGSYVQDIYALLQLKLISAKQLGIQDSAHGYFVLIDRNDPIYGQWLIGQHPRMVWDKAVPQQLVFRRKHLPDVVVNGGLQACGLEVSMTQPPSTNLWIRCCLLDSNQKGSADWRYVWMSQPAPPATLAKHVGWSTEFMDCAHHHFGADR